jgi:hypothetical protein
VNRVLRKIKASSETFIEPIVEARFREGDWWYNIVVKQRSAEMRPVIQIVTRSQSYITKTTRNVQRISTPTNFVSTTRDGTMRVYIFKSISRASVCGERLFHSSSLSYKPEIELENVESDDPEFSAAFQKFKWHHKTIYLLGTLHCLLSLKLLH